MSFEENNNRFKKLIATIGAQKTVIESVIAGGSVSTSKQKTTLNILDEAVEDLRQLMQRTALPEQEKRRRIAELLAEIERVDLLRDFESDFEERMKLVRKLSRLNATLGTWESMEVFHFETLLDPNGQDFKTLLDEADRDIKARQNLQRVLKGIEVSLSLAAFGAALSAKLAATAVV